MILEALRDLVQFVQLKKREKHQCRSATKSNTLPCFSRFLHQIVQRITYNHKTQFQSVFHLRILKLLKQQRFSDIFSGYKMGRLAKNGLISIRRVCVSGGKCLFFRTFGMLCCFERPVLRFALLPYYWGISVNSFVPNARFLYPLKTSENLPVFWRFQGVEKGCIKNAWLNLNFVEVRLTTKI